MNVYEGIDGLRQVPAGSVLSIGNFDGLHLGHARILDRLKSLRLAQPGAKIVIVTFEPHPLTVLRPQFAPPRLTPYPVKQELLASAGVDELVVLPPTRDVLNLSAEQFWSILRDEVRPRHILEGASFSFGKGRGGTVERLIEWSAGTEVRVDLVEGVQVPLLDLHIVEVSSSLIRWLVSYGRVRDAAICLGRPYVLRGKVIRGYGRGRQIGIPTANLDCHEQLIPADGVYAARCILDGTVYPVGLSIGTMPTFGSENQRQVEAHLVGFDADIYERVIDIEMIDWIRDQVRFSGIDDLKIKLAQDISSAVKIQSRDPSHPIAQLLPQ